MADIKVEDLMRSIRERARESGAAQAGHSVTGQGSANSLGRLKTSLTITGRTHDQLPPITTYRRGRLAGAELWIKRLLKRATHWYTWEQTNFNASVHSALTNTLTLFQAHEQRLSSLQNELDTNLASKSVLEAQLAELQSRLALFESRFDKLLAEKTGEIRAEHEKRVELLLNEQRVYFKQLALVISEAGVIADRAKRSMQLRLEELANRVEEMSAEQSEIKTIGRELTDDRDMV